MKNFGLLRIIKASGKITTQDLGRRHWQRLGICESGAADEHAFLWANYLLGNSSGAAMLEITLGQAEFGFTAATQIALTGAKVKAFINQQPVAMWQSVSVSAGDHLVIQLPQKGLLNYLAVRHGFYVKPVCGSASICEREKIGPFDGESLNAGMFLGYRADTSQAFNRRVLSQFIPSYHGKNLSVIFPDYLSPMFNGIKHQMLHQQFIITPQSNRMGCRLTGSTLSLPPENYRNPSAGVPLGAIQIPPDGQPIVLLKDRQTMGGYPIIGCLSRTAAGQISQCRPGEVINFIEIERTKATQQLLVRNQFFGI